MAYSPAAGAVIRIGVEGENESVRRIETVANSMNGLARTVQSAVKTLASTVGIGSGLAGIIQMSDAYTRYTSQVRLATVSQGEYRAALSEIRRIANDAQQGLEGTGTLYARIAKGTAELGVAQSRVAAITEVVNLSLKVSGATATESASAQLQLSQAFASGTLRGEEFNAVNEAAPRLMLALADGIGVPVGALKEMASNGEITSKVMAQVLPQALEKLRAEADQVQTISGSFTVLKNKVLEFTAVQAQANGTVSLLTSGIGLLADNLTLLAGVSVTVTAAKVGGWLATWVTQTYAKVAADRLALASTLSVANANLVAARSAEALAAARVVELRAAVLAAEGNAILALSTNGLIPAQARAAAASQATTAALLAQTAAQRAASVGATVASGALSLLGGPVGVVITLLGLAATAWTIWGNKSEEAGKQSADATRESTDDIIVALDKQIEKLSERNALAKQGVSVNQDSPATVRMGELLTEINKVNKAEGEYSKLDMSAKVAVLQSLGREYSILEEKVGKLNVVSAEQTTIANKKTAGEWMVTYATNSEKLTAELSKAKKELGDQFSPELEARIRKSYESKEAGSTKELGAYQTLIAAIKAKTAENNLEAKAGQNATESQKALIKLDEELAAGKLSLNSKRAAYVRTLLVEQGASEKLLLSQKSEKDVQDTINQSADARLASAAALKTEYEMYGKIGDAREIAMVAIRAEADVEKYLTAAQREGKPVSEDMVARLRTEAAARAGVEQATLAQTKALGYAAQLREENKKFSIESIADPRARADAQLEADAEVWRQRIQLAGEGTAAKKLLQTEFDTWYKNQQSRILVDVDLTRATELLKIVESVDAAARQAASSMEQSFGRVGAAIGGLTTALTGYSVQQQAVAAQLAAVKADPKSSAEKIAQAEILASKASTQARVKSYGDMASAAKGFFKESSAGYKVMAGAEKAYRAVEMALAIETMITKSGLLTAFTGLFVASKATEVAATTATVPVTVAAEGVKQASLATTAMAGAVAVPFPGNLVAVGVVAAMLAAIGLGGFGGGGGASVDIAKQRQEAAGTGSVFGSSSAKSESISNAIELAAANSSIELKHTAGMLASLQAIENSIGGLANLLIRGSGLTGELPAGSDSSAKNLVNNEAFQLAFGGVIGLAFNKLDQALGGWAGKLASSVFGGKVTTLDTGLTAKATSLGSIASGGLNAQQYTDIKKSGGWFSGSKTSTQTTDLGAEANDQFTKVIINLSASVKTAAGLLGLEGDDFTKRLNSFVIDLGKISLKGLDGKGIQEMLETVFSKLGDDMAQFAVGGLEQFQKVGEGAFETLTRIATNYANLNSIMESIGATISMTGTASLPARERLIDLAGGIDALASQTSSFAENFMTEAERLAPVQKYVTEQLAAMGLQALDTRDKFKAYVLDLASSGALATEEGAKRYAQLLALNEAYSKTHKATGDVTKSEAELADERKGLQDQLDEMMLSTAELAAKVRAGVAAQNLALYDQVQAMKAVKSGQDTLLDAYNRQRSALQSVITAQNAAADATIKQMNALKLGDLSTLSPYQKYLEAQRQFDAAVPGEEKNAAAQALLQASRAYNGSTEAYARDYAKVQSALVLQAASQKSAAVIAERQLATLDVQVGKLVDIVSGVDVLNGTMQSVQSAILDLGRSLVAAGQSEQGNAAIVSVLTGIYKDVLGRAPDAAGLDHWLNEVKGGLSYDKIIEMFKGSDEYVKLNGAHATGGVGSGWSLVGEDGPEVVNFTRPGRVYTASQSRDIIGGNSGPSPEATRQAARQAAALEQQNILLAQQNVLLQKLADNTAESASSSDIRGLKQYLGKAISTSMAAA